MKPEAVEQSNPTPDPTPAAKADRPERRFRIDGDPLEALKLVVGERS